MDNDNGGMFVIAFAMSALSGFLMAMLLNFLLGW